MDPVRKRAPDYTDFAYKEAVSKLRYLLAESYSPVVPSSKYSVGHLHCHQHEHLHHHDIEHRTRDQSPIILPHKRPVPSFSPQQQPPPEVVNFIDRQEEYIEQLERESHYYRDELSNLMGKVKEVISENEGSPFKKINIPSIKRSYIHDGIRDDDDDATDDDRHDTEDKIGNVSGTGKPIQLIGPSIVFESRISELEAQLTQTKVDLRKSQEDCDSLRKQLAEVRVFPASGSSGDIYDCDTQRQIDILQREKNELIEVVDRLQSTVAQIRDKEANATQKVKRSLDVVDQAQFEKNQAELEVRRLKGEVDRLSEKLRESAVEQSRRLAEVERRYSTQTEQLTGDLATQWDNNTKLSLELDRQRRLEADLRRELAQKNTTIDELKKELNSKISSLQSEMVQSGVEREGLEGELASTRLALERAERNGRQETARLQAEVQSLRQRLDRADADLLHSRKENLRLTEQISSLEKEVDMAKMMNEEHVGGKREKELTSMILDMDAKHVKSVAELEGMIQSQTNLMEKLKDECHSLTMKLDECTTRHKKYKLNLVEQNSNLMERLNKVWNDCSELRSVCESHISDKMTPWMEDMINNKTTSSSNNNNLRQINDNYDDDRDYNSLLSSYSEDEIDLDYDSNTNNE